MVLGVPKLIILGYTMYGSYQIQKWKSEKSSTGTWTSFYIILEAEFP